MSPSVKILSDNANGEKKHLPPIRGFSMLSILKMIYLHALFYLIPKPEVLFMHSLIHSVFNSYINIYRAVNYVLSIVQFAQDTALRHTNKQTDKQMDKKQPIYSEGT